MRSFLALLLAAAAALSGQRFSAGITAGVPATSTFDTGPLYPRTAFSPQTHRYTIGPTVGFRLRGALRVRLDALYQPFSFDLSDYLETPRFWHTAGSLWQFPAMLEFRCRRRLISPFVEAGPSFQLATGITEISTNALDPTPVISHPEPYRRVVASFATGGGLDFRLGRMHVAPGVRYTRWAAENYDFTQTADHHIGTHLNQVQILVSFRI